MRFEEASIPRFVWKFVKSIIRNPITAGILAFIIYSYIKKHTDKEESLKELMQNNPTQFIELLKEDNTMSNSGAFVQTKLDWEPKKSDSTKGRIKTWSKGNKTVYITKSKHGEYGVGLNTTVFPQWHKDLQDAIKYANNVMKKENINILYEASFNIKPFLDIADSLNSLDEVTKWVKQNHLNVHGHCQNIAALYAYVSNKFTAISTPGHIAFKLNNKVYDPINFNTVPVDLDVWEKKFSNNELKTPIKLKMKEDITLPINVGDTVLGGKFKNKKVLVKSIDKNDKGDITINGKSLLRYRIINKEEYKQLSDDDVKFLDNINKYAAQKIDYKTSNTRWLSERIEEQKGNDLFKHLSSDKSSLKYFKLSPMSEEEGIFFVDVDFLIRKAGNKTGGMDKEISIRDAFNRGIKLPTPQYWLRDNNLGEGNHRVMVAKEFKLKSVPIRVYWK